MAKNTYGRRLKRWRVKRGYSQDRAAQMLRVGFYTYQAWELERRAPTGENEDKVRAFLAEMGA